MRGCSRPDDVASALLQDRDVSTGVDLAGRNQRLVHVSATPTQTDRMPAFRPAAHGQASSVLDDLAAAR